MSAASLREFICRRHPRRKRRGYARLLSAASSLLGGALAEACYKRAAPTEPGLVRLGQAKCGLNFFSRNSGTNRVSH